MPWPRGQSAAVGAGVDACWTRQRKSGKFFSAVCLVVGIGTLFVVVLGLGCDRGERKRKERSGGGSTVCVQGESQQIGGTMASNGGSDMLLFSPSLALLHGPVSLKSTRKGEHRKRAKSHTPLSRAWTALSFFDTAFYSEPHNPEKPTRFPVFGALWGPLALPNRFRRLRGFRQ